MDNKDAELDRLRSAYKSAVDTWVAAIRAEEALASGDHSLREADKWEAACRVAEEAAQDPRHEGRTRRGDLVEILRPVVRVTRCGI
jgi:hypothetical protein